VAIEKRRIEKLEIKEEEMKNVPELLDLKNNVIRLVYEVILKLQF
jgi:hypothetical protein